MDVRTTFRVSVVLVLFSCAFPSWSQPSRSSYDPAAQRQSPKPRDGFLDFMLKGINPSGKDYGQSIAESRNLLLAETIDNAYFWSNVVALALLGWLFILVAYQQKRNNRNEWTAAEMLAQYEQALKRASAQVEEATRRNGVLTMSLVGHNESVLRPLPDRSTQPENPTGRQTPSRAHDARANATESPNGTRKTAKPQSGATAVTAAAGTQIGLFKPDVDLVMKVNSLEQQLARAKEIEEELRRQINGSGRKLQSEQDKNRTLKGG